MIGQRKNTAADIVVVGFALFSMFFGAGNVIFPPFLGMEAGSQWLAGFSTYFIADIGLAMMGMFALLRVGSSEKVLERAGKVPAEILMCAIILCIGPWWPSPVPAPAPMRWPSRPTSPAYPPFCSPLFSLP